MRFPRFRLRTLLALIAVASVVMALIARSFRPRASDLGWAMAKAVEQAETSEPHRIVLFIDGVHP